MNETGKGEHRYLGFDVLHKVPKKQGKKSTSCTVYVPLEWEGKKIAVIRLE